VEREEFAGFYAASFQRLVGQLYAMIGDQVSWMSPTAISGCWRTKSSGPSWVMEGMPSR
jgi:hypothetical protein